MLWRYSRGRYERKMCGRADFELFWLPFRSSGLGLQQFAWGRIDRRRVTQFWLGFELGSLSNYSSFEVAHNIFVNRSVNCIKSNSINIGSRTLFTSSTLDVRMLPNTATNCDDEGVSVDAREDVLFEDALENVRLSSPPCVSLTTTLASGGAQAWYKGTQQTSSSRSPLQFSYQKRPHFLSDYPQTSFEVEKNLRWIARPIIERSSPIRPIVNQNFRPNAICVRPRPVFVSALQRNTDWPTKCLNLRLLHSIQ